MVKVGTKVRVRSTDVENGKHDQLLTGLGLGHGQCSSMLTYLIVDLIAAMTKVNACKGGQEGRRQTRARWQKETNACRGMNFRFSGIFRRSPKR